MFQLTCYYYQMKKIATTVLSRISQDLFQVKSITTKTRNTFALDVSIILEQKNY